MSRIITIANREFKSLFISPIGYVVLFLFTVVMGGLFFWRTFKQGQPVQDGLQELVNWSRFGLFFIVPMLTMSFFSEEYRSGRIETIQTSPIGEINFLLGKFLGAMFFYAVILACLIPHLFFLKICSVFGTSLEYSQLFSCYLGMLLMGAMFIAIGLFFSACTKEQILAGLLALLTLGVFTVLDIFSSYIPRVISLLGKEIRLQEQYRMLTVGKHINDFAARKVDFTDIPYFVVLTFLFLYWTYLVLESKRWR